jgi:hypothetical protein
MSINKNLNVLHANLNRPEPYLINEIYYGLIGGGGGGSQFLSMPECPGGPSLVSGGRGGESGEVVTGSFIITHTEFAYITNVGQGGDAGFNSGGGVAQLGQNGTSSSLEYRSSIVDIAEGGRGNFITEIANIIDDGTALNAILDPNPSRPGAWAQSGGGGHCEPVVQRGGGGGTDTSWFFAPDEPTNTIDAVDGTGGGGGGSNYQGQVGGDGGNGVVILSFYDPEDKFTYETDAQYQFYTNGYRQLYYFEPGFFRIVGRKQR